MLSDKYVSRSEWEDLHTRYTRLEARYERLESIFLDLHPEISLRFSPTHSPSGSIRHSRTLPHSTSRDIPPIGGANFTGSQRTPPQSHPLSFRSSSASVSAPSQSSVYSDDNRNEPSVLLRRPSLIILEPDVAPASSDNNAKYSHTFPGNINISASLTEPHSNISSRASPLSLTSIISGPILSTAPSASIFSPTTTEQRDHRQRSP